VGSYATLLLDSILNTGEIAPQASKRFEQMPFIKRFALDPEARGNITAYYALKHEVDTAVKTMNFLEKSGAPGEYEQYVTDNQALLANKDYVNDLDKQMKNFREMRKQINGMDIPGDEKRDMLTELGQAENNLTENIKEVKRLIANQ